MFTSLANQPRNFNILSNHPINIVTIRCNTMVRADMTGAKQYTLLFILTLGEEKNHAVWKEVANYFQDFFESEFHGANCYVPFLVKIMGDDAFYIDDCGNFLSSNDEGTEVIRSAKGIIKREVEKQIHKELRQGIVYRMISVRST